MNTLDNKRTKRHLIIFIGSVLGKAWLAGIIEPLTVPPDAEPGTSGLGQLFWLILPLVIMVLLRTFWGDGWDDFGLRPKTKQLSF